MRNGSYSGRGGDSGVMTTIHPILKYALFRQWLSSEDARRTFIQTVKEAGEATAALEESRQVTLADLNRPMTI